MFGDFPWSLTPAEVWRLRKDRFSLSEIAHIAGVEIDVAQAMVTEATPGLVDAVSQWPNFGLCVSTAPTDGVGGVTLAGTHDIGPKTPEICL